MSKCCRCFKSVQGLHQCGSCKSYICSSCRKKCSNCGNKYICSSCWNQNQCSYCNSIYCNSCKKYCESCRTTRCPCRKSCSCCRIESCSSCCKKCGPCDQFYCSSHGKGCSSCNQFFCSQHLPSSYQQGKNCFLCNQFYCPSHLQECPSCNKSYCSSDLPKSHQVFDGDSNGTGTETLCLNMKRNGHYEGGWRNGKKHGCGIFTWPSGPKVMQYYQEGNLVMKQVFSVDEQVQHLLEKEKQLWIESKQLEEKEWKKKMNAELTSIEETRKQTEEKLLIQQNKILQQQADLETQRKLIEEERQKMISEFEKEKEKLAIYQKQCSGIVKLNVGGTLFTTSVTTLTKHSDCLFTAIFSGRYNVERDDQGAVFIDRDPTHFNIILNFLRDNTLPPEMSVSAVHALRAEADYYQIHSLITALREYQVTKS